MENSIKEYFNEYGGIQFGVVGMYTYLTGNKYLTTTSMPLFLWFLFCEAIARTDKSEYILPWLDYQLNLIARDCPELRDKLVEEFSKNWTPWLCLVLFSDQDTQKDFLNKYPPKKELLPIYELLDKILTSQGNELFLPKNWGDSIENPDKYSDPHSCSIVKIGILLKKLMESKEEYFKLYSVWRNNLKEYVFHKLPLIALPSLPDDNADNYFNRLVHSIWKTGDFLVSPSSNPDFQILYSHNMKFNDEQMILTALLYGWSKGYLKTGGWIMDRKLRSYLSSLALRLVIKKHPELVNFRNIDPTIFYSTPEGDRFHYEQPFIKISQIDSSKEFEKEIRYKLLKVTLKVGYPEFQFYLDAL